MSKVAKVIGCGMFLPENRVSSDELEKKLNFEKLGVRKGTIKLLNGVNERRIANEDDVPSDFAAAATKEAMEMAKINTEELDAILYCSISSDFTEPATANVIQHKIGANKCQCFDVKNACNAFLNGLQIANALIVSGSCETVLVATGEIVSKYLRTNYQSAEEVSGNNTTLGYGDGGGAVILRGVESDDPMDGIYCRFETYGEFWNQGAIWGGGTTKYMKDSDKFYMQNLNKDMVQKNTARAMFFFYDSMKKSKVKVSDVDLFIPTQASKYQIKNAAEVLKIPMDKVVMQLTEIGNVASCSMPIALCRALKEGVLSLNSGQRVVFLGAGNGFTQGYVTIKL